MHIFFVNNELETKTLSGILFLIANYNVDGQCKNESRPQYAYLFMKPAPYQFTVEWYPLYGPKSLFNFGEKRPIVCYCTHEQKMNFEGITQNGCYGNQPQLFEVVFYSIDTNTSCSFTKQDLTVKQAHSASFCFVL